MGGGVFASIILLIGISYAYWQFVVNQTGNNRVSSTCLSISLEDVTSEIRMENAYPITDEEGMETTPKDLIL